MAVIRFFIFFMPFVSALVLVGCGGSTYAPVVSAWNQPAAANSAYLVRPGDTLYSIAWAFGLDYRSLAEANGLKPPYIINAGQRLRMTTGVSRQSSRQLPASRGNKVKVSVKPKVKPKISQRAPRHVVFNGAWRWPTVGRLVAKYNPKAGGNNGIDIAGRLGQPIKAAASGVVVYSGTGVRSYGHLIIIKHNSSYLSAYAYNMRNLVKVGMRVQRGQTIATMGNNNGGKTMLHFEIRKDGRPVNPLNYLR
ncbi:MAG: peptidoglycan DD-metalloendopeptidase family protein [Coxiellaceae bacterium]|nr:peptidoglycan DD-metalloendopeptidase family protein [Coxiellaceae bacterium]